MRVLSCPFCKIIAGQTPARILYQDEQATAFWDARPIAPVHVLIVPNEHIHSNNEVAAEHAALLGHLNLVAARLARELKVDQSGYRLVINTGPDAGQSVFHLHMHLIGGRRMPFSFQGGG